MIAYCQMSGEKEKRLMAMTDPAEDLKVGYNFCTITPINNAARVVQSEQKIFTR